MTFIGTDEQLANCLRLAANTRSCPTVHAGAMIEAAARIEALTAERDAAMAALNMKPHERNSHALGIMEGERRGSAKAVVFMKREYAMDGWDVVSAIERGDHLTAHKP